MNRRTWLALTAFAALWIVSDAIYLVATHGGP